MCDVRDRMKNKQEYLIKKRMVADRIKKVQRFIDTLSAVCHLPAYGYF